MEKAKSVGVLATQDEDIRSLRELITYGLKGLSAYSKHANVLLADDAELDAFLQRALAATLDDTLSVNDLVALALETGKYGVKGMALLDGANTQAYGNPEITKVNIGVGKRPGILVSGHDLRDLEMLLEQTKDRPRRCIYPFRNVTGTLLSGVQKVQAFCRQLRKCMVETDGRICVFPWSDPDDDQLYRTAKGFL